MQPRWHEPEPLPCVFSSRITLEVHRILYRHGFTEEPISRSSRTIRWGSFVLRLDHRGDDLQSTETEVHNTDKSTSRLNLVDTGRVPKNGASKMNDYAVRNASGGCFTLHYLELALNLFQ